jgi:hypothetical protein
MDTKGIESEIIKNCETQLSADPGGPDALVGIELFGMSEFAELPRATPFPHA